MSPSPASLAGWAALLLLLAAVPAAAVAIDDYTEVVRTIRCDCGCHPQSVESCACGRADQMREIIAGQVEGKNGREPMTAKAIIAQYVAEHGEQIRIAPAATGFNLVAWLGPLVGLVLGLFAAVALVRYLARTREATPAEALAGATTPPTVALDDPYRARLREHLKEWD